PVKTDQKQETDYGRTNWERMIGIPFFWTVSFHLSGRLSRRIILRKFHSFTGIYPENIRKLD
ncbi:MAG: hypothetical protein WC061_10820, partial [Melioribacteraceae bacterium]